MKSNFIITMAHIKLGEFLFAVEPPSVLPIKPQTAEFKFVFSGWDKDIKIETIMEVH